MNTKLDQKVVYDISTARVMTGYVNATAGVLKAGTLLGAATSFIEDPENVDLAVANDATAQVVLVEDVHVEKDGYVMVAVMVDGYGLVDAVNEVQVVSVEAKEALAKLNVRFKKY